MNPRAEALKKRTHDFFVRVIRLCQALPKTREANSIAEQLLDSAGSTDSNYGAACKARSPREFVAKIGLVAEEADESYRWLEALRDASMGDRAEVVSLATEANELAAIFVKSHKTSSENLEKRERREAAERAARRRNHRET